MSLPHATWSPWNSPYYFIQLDIRSHAIIQESVHWFVFHQNDWNYFLPYTKLNQSLLFLNYARPSLGAIDQMFRP